MVYQYQPVNPLQSFAQGFQFVDAIKQRQAQQEQQRMEMAQKEQRGMALQSALQGIRTNPTPEAIAEFYLQFPEMKEQFDAYRGALGEGDKTTLTSAAREALVAQRAGQSSAAVFKRYAEAAKNSKRMDLAKQFEDAAAMAEASPDSADLTTRMFFQGVDPDGYKAVFGQTERIQNYEFFKNEVGEKEALEIVGVTPKDGIQVLPNGMVIAGPDSPLAKSMGGGGEAASLPQPKSKADYDALPPGTEYIGPDGKPRVKAGGTGGNASGSFR